VPDKDFQALQAFRKGVRAWTDEIISSTDVVRASLAEYLRRHRRWTEQPPPAEQREAAD
jgi:hypothetical protein